MKASRCGNERQGRSDRRKAGKKGKWKKPSYLVKKYNALELVVAFLYRGGKTDGKQFLQVLA